MFGGSSASAEDALLQQDRVQPNLVLTDLSLPGMNGLELLNEVQKRSPGLACLMLSAHRSRIYADEARRAGARGYVCKSELERVEEILHNVLHGHLEFYGYE